MAVFLLAAVEPASAQQLLNYAGQSDASVDVSYSNLPAGTQLFYVNEVTGGKSAAPVPLVGGTGTLAIPMPPGPGPYSIMSSADGNWVAQTVVFYSKDPAPSGTSTSSWSVTIANDGQVTSFGGSSTDGTITYNTAPPPPSDPTPPAPSMVSKNIVTDFGAICDGVSDVAPAFAQFNTWAKTQTLPVSLTIPSGSVCSFRTSAAQWWAKDIKNLLVMGYGATIRNDLASGGQGFFLGGRGIIQNSTSSAATLTAAAGASSVRLQSPSQASMFTVGGYALMTGFDLQGYGFPVNPHFFEYVQVTAIDQATGTVTFAAPLKNRYSSTWPSYWGGNLFEANQGGPATLYLLEPSWDTVVEYRGLTIVNDAFQTYATGRSVTYKDVKFTGEHCGIPTQNLIWQAINTDMSACTLEADKMVGTVVMNGVTIKEIGFQSSSTDLLSMSNSTVTYRLIGTPKKAVISDSAIANFWPGAYAFGRTDEVVCTNCALNVINPLGITEKGPNDIGVNNAYQMANGIITVPNSLGPVRWAVPGTNLMWTGAYESETAFQVLDVTQDATNTYVRTSLSGGFPQIPTYSNTGKLYIRVHPAPKFTCTNCTGSADAVDLSQAPAGAPIYSYSKRTYTGGTIGTSPAPTFPIWGTLTSVNLKVTTPYTGSQSGGGVKTQGKDGHGAASVTGLAGSGCPFRTPDPPVESQDAPVHLRRALGHLHHRSPEDAAPAARGAGAVARRRAEG